MVNYKDYNKICKKKNVQCLLLSMPKLGNKTLISETVHKFDNIEKLDITKFTNRNTEEILDYIKKSSPTSVIQKYIKNYSNSLYLRFEVKDKPGVLSSLTSLLAKKNISVERLIQIPNHKMKTASIVIVTHKSREIDAQKCFKSFLKNKNILKIPTLIRLF